MASCAYCNTTILFGGVKDGEHRFCNEKCRQDGFLATTSQHIPEELVGEYLEQLHQGHCPKCQGRGPVDVHNSHQIFSVLVMTRWSSKSLVACRSCGVKSQLGSSLLSLVVGWWGFPWGLIMTPVQVTRNVVGIFKGPNPVVPSAALKRHVRLHLAAHLMANSQNNRAGM